jgi:hypothetical protein
MTLLSCNGVCLLEVIRGEAPQSITLPTSLLRDEKSASKYENVPQNPLVKFMDYNFVG